MVLEDGLSLRVMDWIPGKTLADMTVNGENLVMKIGKISGGFRVRSRGRSESSRAHAPSGRVGGMDDRKASS